MSMYFVSILGMKIFTAVEKQILLSKRFYFPVPNDWLEELDWLEDPLLLPKPPPPEEAALEELDWLILPLLPPPPKLVLLLLLWEEDELPEPTSPPPPPPPISPKPPWPLPPPSPIPPPKPGFFSWPWPYPTPGPPPKPGPPPLPIPPPTPGPPPKPRPPPAELWALLEASDLLPLTPPTWSPSSWFRWPWWWSGDRRTLRVSYSPFQKGTAYTSGYGAYGSSTKTARSRGTLVYSSAIQSIPHIWKIHYSIITGGN